MNAWGLKDPSKCVHLLGELSIISVDVTAVQEIHFICPADCRVLGDDSVILSAFSSCSSVGVRIWVSLNGDVKLVLADDGGQLVVADIVKSFEFLVDAIYAPNIVVKRFSFFRQLAPFPDNPKWIVLMGDWNGWLEGELEGREGVKAAWSILCLTMTWSIGFDWISQGGRCWCSKSVRPLSMLDLIWTECLKRWRWFCYVSHVPLCSANWL